MKVISGLVLFSIDSTVMGRKRNWNFRQLFFGGFAPQALKKVGRKEGVPSAVDEKLEKTMKLVTVKKLSEFTKVKPSTLYAWASRGLIPCHRLNGLLRFDMDEILEWIKAHRKYSEICNRKTSRSHRKTTTCNADDIARKAIDDVLGKGYNSSEKGKPDHQARKGG